MKQKLAIHAQLLSSLKNPLTPVPAAQCISWPVAQNVKIAPGEEFVNCDARRLGYYASLRSKKVWEVAEVPYRNCVLC